VTAILGFNCTDGVLLFADTEMSFSDSGTKSEGDKLRVLRPPHGTIITGSAGTVDDIEYANFRLAEELLQKPPTSGAGIQSQLEKLTAKIANKHGRWLDIDMLIGIRPHTTKQTLLFKWTGDLVYPLREEFRACAGSGVIQLDPLLRRIDFTGNAEAMLWYGTKLMLEAKRMVQGVGGKTEALLLRHADSGYTQYPTEMMDRIEYLVIEMERVGNERLIPFIAGTEVRQGDTELALRNIKGALSSIGDKYQAIIRPQIHPIVQSNLPSPKADPSPPPPLPE